MGWLEFRAWLRELNRQRSRKSNPDTWDGADEDPNWIELRAQRRRVMGRG